MKDSETPKHDPLKDAQACIVWHPVDRAPAPSLLKALNNKGMTIVDAEDAHTAFAAAQRASKSAKRTVIVLDTRDELHDVDRMIASIERFMPQVLCWAHEPGANPPLIPLVQPRKTRELTPSTSSGSCSGKAPTPLRLVGHDDHELKPELKPKPKPEPKPESTVQSTPTPNPPPTKPAAPLSARDVLDADELNALLAGELGDRKH